MEIKTSLFERLLEKVVKLQDGVREFNPKKVYKHMITSSQEEIDLHNKGVKTRQVVRSEKRINDKFK